MKAEGLCRETGGADQEWEELDRLEAELVERKARRKAEGSRTSGAEKRYWQLPASGPSLAARQHSWAWLVGNPGRRPGSGSLF